MKLSAKYVGKVDPKDNTKTLHKIKLMVGGSPFISGHSYKTKASAAAAAKRLNLSVGGVASAR